MFIILILNIYVLSNSHTIQVSLTSKLKDHVKIKFARKTLTNLRAALKY